MTPRFGGACQDDQETIARHPPIRAHADPAGPRAVPVDARSTGGAARVQLFHNPASGSYSAATIAALAAAFTARGATVLPGCSSDGPPTLDERVTHVCIAAGDGTVRHIGAAVAASGQAPILGIYPAGTVNLLAMEGEYPRDPARFADRLLYGETVRFHYPVAIDGKELFFASASAGPDSAAIARVSARLKRVIGRLAYVVAFLGVLRCWRRPRIRLEADRRRIDCEAFYLAKGHFFAGRWTFAPQTRVDIPTLRLVALTTARRRDFARFVWALLRGIDPATLPGIVACDCTTLTASGEAGVVVQADGDIVATLPARFALAPPLAFR
ncbi:MAG TPA: diacylglycerol kinase family protein [Sphingomonas sp.]